LIIDPSALALMPNGIKMKHKGAFAMTYPNRQRSGFYTRRTTVK
jgi:hypothetical protein